MSILEFRLLGGCEIRLDGRPLPPPRYRKEWWLLALLVLHHDREVSRDAVAADFWPDSDPDRALLYLRRSLTNLRRALGPEAGRLLSPSPRTLRFNLDGAFADAVAFDQAARAASGHGPVPEEVLSDAAALYVGPLLSGCDEPWVLPEREERAQAYLRILEALAAAAQGRGEPGEAASWLRRLVAADPLRESGHAALMRALADAGDRAAAAQVFQDLRRRLRDEKNAEPSPETALLFRDLMAREATPAPLPPPAAPLRSHLPVPLTELIGRNREVAEVTTFLRRDRLVTLLGEGGIGKTRLSIAAAGAARPDFPAGVWFVDLAPLDSPALVPEAVAQTLGLGEEAGRPAEARLEEAIGTTSLLLILDNCEHILAACATLAARLLAACPHLRVLATSRQALGVMGERVCAVPPLDLPPPAPLGTQADPANGEKNVFALLEYDSVRLFVERASQASPAFRLSRRSADAVAEICRSLDGIPLALELAAARVRSLSPQEIGARLDDRLSLLSTGNRGAPRRHQALRATIDWSYAQLSDTERALMRRLSVFAGGWDMKAAEAVCSGDGNTGDVLDGVASLVDKSLVSAETRETANGEVSRFRLRETIRQYAQERLREAGEENDARTRHRNEFGRLAAQARPEMQGPDLAAWLDRLEREIDNFRAALDWCVTGPDGALAGLQLAADLFFLWWVRGYFAEGRRWYEAVLRREGAGQRTAVRAKALSRAGGLLSISGEDPAAARAHFEEGLSIARELADRKAEANLLCNLGDIATGTDLPAARDLFAQSLAIHREIGNRPGTAHAALLLGNVALQQDRHDEAEALYEESLALYRGLGNPQKTGHALWCMARTDLGRGRIARAQALLEECVALFRGLSDPWGLSAALALAGEAAMQSGDATAARPRLAEHMALVRRMGLRRSAPWVLRCFGRLASAQKEWARVARLFGAADALESGSLRQPAAADLSDASLGPEAAAAATAARQALDTTAFTVAWMAGSALSLDQAAIEALRDEPSFLN